MLQGVPRNGRAAQALEQTELDLVRAQCMQAIESFGKTLPCLARQTKDEVGVQVGW